MIDGKLDEEMWRQAVLLKDFVQISPGGNIEPSNPTKVLLSFDENKLYLGFKCFDDRDKIRVSFVKRYSAFTEDNMRVFVNTFDDKRRGFLFGFIQAPIQSLV